MSVRLRRSAGTPIKYLMLVNYRDKVAARGNQGIPQLRETSSPDPHYANVSPQIEAFAFIHHMAAV